MDVVSGSPDAGATSAGCFSPPDHIHGNDALTGKRLAEGQRQYSAVSQARRNRITGKRRQQDQLPKPA